MTETYKVINVEDDPFQFALTKAILKELPLELHHAATGEEGIKLLTEMSPDLLILDVTLPDMRGWDVLDEIVKKQGKLKDCPILVLTGHTEVPHRIIASLQDVAVYMNKPFEPLEFRSTVKELLEIES